VNAITPELAQLLSAYDEMVAALAFYADPGSYHAVAFHFDPPCGGFAEDFSEDHGEPFYDRPMPGATARRALARWQETIP
jgi:hypothetical protein